MKKTFILIIALLATSLAYAESGEERLNNLLTNIKTMQASFSQKVMAKGKVVQESSGEMALQRPGKFRWNIMQPIPQLIIANEGKLYIFDTALDQITIRSLSKTTEGATPALLLTDENLKLSDDFHVQQTANSLIVEPWFRLLPKSKDSVFVLIKIHFVNDLIAEMQLTDRLDQTTIIKFSNVTKNVSFKSSTFKITVPKGVDVIDETKES